MKNKCDYDCCDEPAEYYDDSDNKICEDCMDREILEYGAKAEDFESIIDVKRALSQADTNN